MPTIAEKYAATLRVVEDAEDSESQEISEDGEKRLVLEWNEIRRRSTVRVRKGIHRYTFSDRPAVLAPASIEVLWSLPHPGCTLRVLLDRGRPVAPEQPGTRSCRPRRDADKGLTRPSLIWPSVSAPLSRHQL